MAQTGEMSFWDHLEDLRRCIFRILGVFALVTIVVMLIVSIIALIKYRGSRRMRLSAKFQLVLTPVVVIILSSIFLLSIEHSRRVFIDTQQLRLSKKAQYVQMALQNMYFWDLTLSPANTMSLNIDLRDMSFAYEIDIHVYDLNGRLIGSSTPQLFDLGLLPTHLSPEAFFSGKQKIITHEHIGEVKYLAAYTEFINGNYAKIGYIALPSFISQKEMTDHLQDFVLKLLPLYIFLLLISIIVVWGISHMITSSLRLVIEQLQQNKLNPQSKHIDYPFDDEFGEMVEHYNQMMDVLGRVAICADAAQAFGASRKGQMVGSIADFTAFSFHAVKNLTTAEGGALTWKSISGIADDEIYHMVQLYSLHGQSKDALAKTKLGAWEYDIVGPWYKCNMTDIAAAIGLVQMKRYAGMLQRRKEIIQHYDKALKAIGIETLNHYCEEHQSSGHLYITRVPNITTAERQTIIEQMAERGIATNVHYKPLPMMTAYKNMGFNINNYPNAYTHFANEITLPLHTRLTDEEIEYIIGNYIEIVKQFI